MQRQSIEDRFWSKVEKLGPNDCWLWKAGKRGGYGRFMIKGKLIGATRFIWEQLKGPIPKGFLVCHHCDNPPCCNPSHLFIGTRQDNMDDAMKKGRLDKTRPRGQEHGMANLTDQQVIDIRKRYANGGISYQQLANESGIPKATISHIIIGNTWKHISYGLPSKSIRAKQRQRNYRAYFPSVKV